MSVAPAPTGAVRYLSGARRFEQADVDAQARRAASGFAALGVGEGDGVGLVMVNEVEVLVCHQALALLGASAVPMGWHSTPDEIAYIAADANLAVVVAHDVTVEAVERALGRAPGARLPVVVVETPDETAAALRLPRRSASPAAVRWSDWQREQPQWDGAPREPRPAVIYTSGTTGKPKGVLRQAHADAAARELHATSTGAIWGARDGGRTLLVAPLYHSAPLAYTRAAIRAARTSGQLHLLPRFDAERVLATIAAQRITSVWMVPTMFIRLLALPEAVRSAHDLSSLTNVLHSGAPCPVDVKLRLIDWLGPVVNEFYGSTETGPITYATSEDYLAHPGTAGRLLEHCRAAVVDDHGHEVPTGTPGELAVANSTYASFTYRNREAEREGIDLAGLVLTGDVALFDEDGFLYLKDRKKDMVISGGVNLYPAEVEDVLLQLPNVRDGAAVGVPDADLGEKLVVAIELEHPEPGVEARVLADLRTRLSQPKVPKQVVVVDDFPRSDTGKVAKHRLRSLLSDPPGSTHARDGAAVAGTSPSSSPTHAHQEDTP